MMRFLTLIILLLLTQHYHLLAQTSDVNKGCVPLEVNFNAPSGHSAYFWDFKDGVTSDLENPSTIFTKAGTYKVEFKESSSGPLIGTVTIIVYPDPVLQILTIPGCGGNPTELSSTSIIDPQIPITNYTWVFGDGSSSQGSKTTSHVYYAPGDYTLSFNITSSYPTCTKTKIFKNAVHIPISPSAYFETTPDVTSTCGNSLNVQFKNSSSGELPLTYTWNLGNGLNSTAINPASQTYPVGNYTISLTAKYTNTNGCVSTYSKPVNVGSPVSKIINTNPTVLCADSFFKFYTPARGLYSWKVDGIDIVPSPPPFYTHYYINDPMLIDARFSILNDTMYYRFFTGGIHKIELSVKSMNGLCSSVSSINVNVEQYDVIASDQYVCHSPAIVTYNASATISGVKFNWLLGKNILKQNSASYTTTHDKTRPDPYSLNYDYLLCDYFSQTKTRKPHLFGFTIEGKSLNGCKAEKNVSTTMAIPNALFEVDKTQGCAPLNVTFSDQSLMPYKKMGFDFCTFIYENIVKWQWFFGDGTNTISNSQSAINHTYNKAGTYFAKLVVTTETGCTDTSYAIKIVVGEDISSKLDFSVSKTEVCVGENVDFTAQVDPSVLSLISAYHFQTEENRSSNCFKEKSLTWSYNNVIGPQNASLEVSYNGCFSKVTKNNIINVKGAVAKIDYLALCSKPLEYTFVNKSLGSTNVTWNLGDNTTSNSTTSFTHTYNRGEYTVRLTAQDITSGCPSTSDVQKIYVKTIKAGISLNSKQCNGLISTSGASSTDVYATCHKGFTWYIDSLNSKSAPFTTDIADTKLRIEKSGIHTLYLITTDINGCTDTSSTKLTTYGITANYVTNTDKICLPNTVEYTDLSVSDTTITKWKWYFDDSLLSKSTIQNPNFLYTTKTNGYNPDDFTKFIKINYTPSLVVENIIGCKDSIQPFAIKYYKPYSTISSNKPNFCIGETSVFTAADYTQQGSSLNYLWTFPNGATSTTQTSNIVFPSTGSYLIKLKYTENGSGCTDSLKQTVSVQDYPNSTYTTNVDTLKVLCAPQNVFFDASTTSQPSPVSHFWDFGNGQSSFNPQFALFYAKGIYKTKHITTTSFGCTDTTYKDFHVYSPEGKFSMDKSIICKGEVVNFNIYDTLDVASYTWAYGDGYVKDNTSPVSHAYNFHPPSGTTPVRLIIRGTDGICPVELEQPLKVHEVIADFQRLNGIDTTICFKDGPYPLTNKSFNYDYFKWNFGDGNTNESIVSPNYQYSKPGTYNVSLFVSNNENKCVDTITKPVVVLVSPDIKAIGDTVCQGQTLNLSIVNPNATSNYQWTPTTGLANANATSTTSTIQHTIIYEAEETATNGCKDRVQVPGIIIEPINLRDFDTSIVIGDIATFPAKAPQDVYIYSWKPSVGLSCYQCDYPTLQPLKDTIYYLNVKDVRGCFSNDYIYQVHIRPETFVKMPTVFTPNGDGINDKLYVKGWGIKELLNYSIYNRWGQLIYSTNDINEGWDGTFNNAPQANDIYVYKVKALNWRDQEVFEEGYVNLLH
jgi:gliding motility-associated-like protein